MPDFKRLPLDYSSAPQSNSMIARAFKAAAYYAASYWLAECVTAYTVIILLQSDRKSHFVLCMLVEIPLTAFAFVSALVALFLLGPPPFRQTPSRGKRNLSCAIFGILACWTGWIIDGAFRHYGLAVEFDDRIFESLCEKCVFAVLLALWHWRIAGEPKVDTAA